MECIDNIELTVSQSQTKSDGEFAVTFEDIKDAYDRIKPYVHKTPVMTSKAINEIAGKDLYFKCENLQKVGAFKFRGACNAVFKLTEEDLKKGVVTHSSGNHGQALALAAKMRGTTAYVVVPNNAPKIKLDAIQGYGANVTLCEPTLVARESGVEKLIQEHGATLIHPFDNREVIAGQGTVAIELLSQVENLDAIIVPIGGGGVCSGISIAAKRMNPEIKIIGVEPTGADDACRSFKKGERLPHLEGYPNTIADGLLTTVGDLTWPVIKSHLHNVLTVDDNEIKAAMKLVWDRMKLIIEPSSATVLAAVLSKEFKELYGQDGTIKRIGLIVTGGNVDLAKVLTFFS
ncbi:serine racemase [Heterostelium album PN500]|uniref:Serine racemase n=1 Tax=Heterostelium pallidum (strain ATCC 26659 / Pp 5 / PN500) TaxID=670386 RepID=D3B961_HETP5|nr:serine racemase [Heterostelium album PN500]EFA82100.1 serine racemase [Heterostelium album PN500]|eukprot:XP_020434217.1 serine racemase [Heterostelium album PN500]